MKLLSVWLLSLSCFIMVAANAQQTDVEKRIAKSLKNIEKSLFINVTKRAVLRIENKAHKKHKNI